jgi:hypothetical protein
VYAPRKTNEVIIMEGAHQNEKNNKNYHNGHCACSHSPSVIPTNVRVDLLEDLVDV